MIVAWYNEKIQIHHKNPSSIVKGKNLNIWPLVSYTAVFETTKNKYLAIFFLFHLQ
jgi:hypothetical protein